MTRNQINQILRDKNIPTLNAMLERIGQLSWIVERQQDQLDYINKTNIAGKAYTLLQFLKAKFKPYKTMLRKIKTLLR